MENLAFDKYAVDKVQAYNCQDYIEPSKGAEVRLSFLEYESTKGLIRYTHSLFILLSMNLEDVCSFDQYIPIAFYHLHS